MEFLETVRWRDGHVRILDQTRLPGAEIYRDLATVDEVCEAILTLAVRGAPAIGVAGALGLALAAQQPAELLAAESERGGPGPDGLRSPAGSVGEVTRWLNGLRAAHAKLAAVRPTAVNLRWALDRVWESLERRRTALSPSTRPEAVIEELRLEAWREASRILEEDLALSQAMAEHGAPLLPQEGKVLTHCNTGGLATAGGGTALGVVFEAVRLGKRIFVCVDETRPLLQGARLTAWELQQRGIPFAIQCDGAAAWRMKTTRVDAVLVGADRVAANGDTANKVGTLAVALAAREFGVPFYVVAPRSSFDPAIPHGDAIPIEERSPEELLRCGGAPTAPEGAGVWNPAFDVTPARLITGWVTDRGLERPPFATHSAGSGVQSSQDSSTGA